MTIDILKQTGVGLVLLLVGCANPADRAQIDKSKWVLKLQVEGQSVTMPLEAMYVYLTDNDDYPESFEMFGENVNLVGEFPLSLRVGYEEDWKKIVNQEIKIMPRVRPDYYFIENPSSITLPGKPKRYISSGTLTVKKVAGKMGGLEGDITLSGEITLNISVADEILRVVGTFSVHGVSLG